MNNLLPTVKNLIIINVLMFLVLNICIELNIINLNAHLGMYYFGTPMFRIHQLFTHFFMHADIMHIAFNMISLYSIGNLLERFWGSKRLLNFYIICGLGAAIFHQLILAAWAYYTFGHFMLSNIEIESSVLSIAVGASGAVFGMFAAVALLFPNSEFFVFFIPFPIKAKYLLIAAVIISISLGVMNFSGDNIAHFAHLGGIITGYLMVKLNKQDRKRFY